MKRILCYGDSNTWGFVPAVGQRFPEDVRWTGLLQKAMPDCRIIEEGLNGRTTVWEDPIELYKSGKDYLPPCLETHSPIDLVILMLGTNDFKRRFSLSAIDIALGAKRLISIIQSTTLTGQNQPPRVLLVRPAPIRQDVYKSPFYGMFDERSYEVSTQTLPYFKQVAEEMGCALLDAETCTEMSELDSIHLTEKGHTMFAAAVEKIIKEQNLLGE